MKITLNHRPSEYPEETLTVEELMKRMKFTFPMIVVKINGRLVRKEEYRSAAIHEGDQVEAIHLISGG